MINSFITQANILWQKNYKLEKLIDSQKKILSGPFFSSLYLSGQSILCQSSYLFMRVLAAGTKGCTQQAGSYLDKTYFSGRNCLLLHYFLSIFVSKNAST